MGSLQTYILMMDMSLTGALTMLQEMCKIDGLQQDCREAFLNEKLARKWKGGEAWAHLDLAGLHFTHHKCTQFLVSFQAMNP